jgi:hypothetical protein
MKRHSHNHVDLYVRYVHLTKAKHIQPIFSSERMLHKDYYYKSSTGKESLVVGLKGPGVMTNLLAVNIQS